MPKKRVKIIINYLLYGSGTLGIAWVLKNYVSEKVAVSKIEKLISDNTNADPNYVTLLQVKEIIKNERKKQNIFKSWLKSIG